MTKPNPIRHCAACGNAFRKAFRHETYCSLNCLLWSRVDRRSEDECWPWTGSRNSFGYGEFRYNGKLIRAHRLVCEMFHGKPAAKAHAMHSCDNPPCCNPAHLSFGTAADNHQDALRKGRWSIEHPCRGTDRHNAKLNDEKVRAIRGKLASGTSVRALAREYAVAQRTISQVRDGLTWRHVL